MIIRNILILTVVAALVVVLGCTSPPGQNQQTLLEKNWGRSFETAKYNQILNPEAGRNEQRSEGSFQLERKRHHCPRVQHPDDDGRPVVKRVDEGSAAGPRATELRCELRALSNSRGVAILPTRPS